MAKHRGRTPFGYDIVGGVARVNEGEAERLRAYFRRYLNGASMAESARLAGLSCSPTTYPHLFRRREYVGDGYYPAIIAPDVQRRLVAEWERRRAARTPSSRGRTRRDVPLHVDFCLIAPDTADGDSGLSAAEALYERIAPLDLL